MSKTTAKQYTTNPPIPDTGSADAPLVALASDVQRKVLDNGLSILVKEVYPAPGRQPWPCGAASARRTGDGRRSRLQPLPRAHAVQGDADPPVGTIAQQVHGLGGHMNAFTSYDCTCYWMVIPSRHLDLALDIQVDALLHSLFRPARKSSGKPKSSSKRC